MSTEHTETKISILDYKFKIKCPTTEISALQESARYVENKMSAMRSNDQIFNLDSVAVITALNIAHEFLAGNQDSALINKMSQRINLLNSKIKEAL